MNKELWAVNIAGPDDILAVASRKEAVTLAAAMNAFFVEKFEQNPHPFDPLMWAVPCLWPHSPASHSDNLGDLGEYSWAKQIEATP